MTREEWGVHNALDNIRFLVAHVTTNSCQIKSEGELSDMEILDILDGLDKLKIASFKRLRKMEEEP